MEFTGVELATPVKKAATSLMEKATAGRSSGEDGPRWAAMVGRRRHGEGERRTTMLGAVEMPTGGRSLDDVKNAEVARWSTITALR